MENHPTQCTKQYFYILMNYGDTYVRINPKREKCVTLLQYSDVRPSSGNTFIPCIVLAKDDNSQEAFPVLRK